MNANDENKQVKDESVTDEETPQINAETPPEPSEQKPPSAEKPPACQPDDSSAKMKEQVTDISKKIGRAFSDFGKKFAKESSDVYEQGKQEVRIISLDRKLHDLEADLGRKLYNLWSMGRIRDPLITELLTKELEEIDKYDEEREVAKELLDNIRYKPEGDSK